MSGSKSRHGAQRYECPTLLNHLVSKCTVPAVPAVPMVTSKRWPVAALSQPGVLHSSGNSLSYYFGNLSECMAWHQITDGPNKRHVTWRMMPIPSVHQLNQKSAHWCGLARGGKVTHIGAPQNLEVESDDEDHWLNFGTNLLCNSPTDALEAWPVAHATSRILRNITSKSVSCFHAVAEDNPFTGPVSFIPAGTRLLRADNKANKA